VRPSSQENCFALSYVKLDGSYAHLLVYHTDNGWIADEIDGVHSTLYSLLNQMSHFINLADSAAIVPEESHHAAR
jgi:hypothetical protein